VAHFFGSSGVDFYSGSGPPFFCHFLYNSPKNGWTSIWTVFSRWGPGWTSIRVYTNKEGGPLVGGFNYFADFITHLRLDLIGCFRMHTAFLNTTSESSAMCFRSKPNLSPVFFFTLSLNVILELRFGILTQSIPDFCFINRETGAAISFQQQTRPWGRCQVATGQSRHSKVPPVPVQATHPTAVSSCGCNETHRQVFPFMNIRRTENARTDDDFDFSCFLKAFFFLSRLRNNGK